MGVVELVMNCAESKVGGLKRQHTCAIDVEDVGLIWKNIPSGYCNIGTVDAETQKSISKIKTDYSRHLDEVSKETERVLLKTLQELLVNGKTDEARELLMQWESCVALNRTTTQKMEEELNVFSRKIFKMNDLWNKLKLVVDNDTKCVLTTLQERSESMLESVKREGSLNAGGKFEWVDSILIKCLQDGSWLLIDNVNLCSSAVLDRLNGLLEPHGVLTISERGVDQNGQMVEIRPHKDFRLFLTMDPKNGEISRAMRNRGIEIYILNEKDEVVKQNQLDTKSLINLEGLKESNLIETLLKIHNFIRDLTLGEKPHINDLLQASSLISQQMSHGVDLLEAFFNTVIEIYYKTRSSVEFNCNDTENVIKDEIKRIVDEQLSATKTENLNDYDITTMKTQNIESCSIIEKIKQQSALLQNYSTKSHEKNNLFVNFLINFYSVTSRDDLKMRHLYLKSNFNHLNIEILVNDLYKVVTNRNVTECLTFPLDHRWIPETPYNIQNASESNILNLALNITAYYFREKCDVDEIKIRSKQQKEVTLLDYMHEKQKKRVEDKFNNIIINEYLALIKGFDDFLHIMPNKINILADKDVIAILYLVSWRFSFHKCTLVNIKNLSVTGQYNILINLAVHYKWFLKYAVRQVEAISRVNIPQELKERLESINAKLDTQFSFMHKIGKNYQRFSSTPPPFINGHQLEVVPSFNRISSWYNLCDKLNDPINILCVLKGDVEIRKLLVDLKCSLDYNFTDLSTKMIVLQSLHEKHKESDVEKICKFELQLLPVLDYFTQTMIKYIMRTIPKIKDINTISNNILVPTDLSGILVRYENTQDIRLLHEITKWYYLYLMNSASVRPSVYLNDEKDDNQGLFLSGCNPKLIFYLSHLLVNTSVPGNTGSIKLGNFRQLMRQHRHLSLIIWGNLYQLSEKSYDYLHNEKMYIIRIFQIFIIQFAESLNINETNRTTIQEITTKCIERIKETKLNSTRTDPDNDMLRCISHLEACSKNITKLSQITDDINSKFLIISDLYMELSYVKATLNSKLPLIDPLAKKTLKKNYCVNAINMFRDMEKCYELQNEIYSNSSQTLHAYYEPVRHIVEDLEEKNTELGKYVAFRSPDVLYEAVLKVIGHAFATILSENHVKQTTCTLNDHISKVIAAISQNGNFDCNSLRAVLRQKESVIISYENLIHEWSHFRNSYPDVIEPLLSNLAEFLYGFKLKLVVMKKVIGEYDYMKLNVNIQDITKLVRFPVISETQNCYNKHVEYYTGKSFSNFIVYELENEEFPHVKKQETFRLLRCGIHETFNICVLDAKTTDVLNRNLFMNFNKLLNVVINAWNKQKEEKEFQQKEAESLYKMKTKCDDKPEEQQIEEELKELFPNYHEIDFQDLRKDIDLGDNSPEESNLEDQFKEVISYGDIQFIIRLHMILMQNYTKTEWLNPSRNKNIVYDFIQPLLEKHKVFKQILDKCIYFADYKMDTELINSFSVLLAVKQGYGETNHLIDVSSPTRILQKKNKDFYKDPNVEEVKSCYHILEELKIRIQQLLDEWPDQPTLRTILLVIERIYDFDITSPVSRFLTGFEILLSKCHEWEEVAHAGVSLSQYYQNITQQIIHWRKLELNMWKDLLNRTYERLNEPLAKWWLYMYNTMHQFIVEKSFTSKELIETLQSFLTKSNLAEFQGRLDILYVFHCHATYMEKTSETEAFTSVLWNLHSYFQQFGSTISNKIKDLRSPIEKKLKDYVKIVKWKDISYWAIKETVDKSHKTLHKYVREFQEVLLQPASPYLVNTGNNETDNVGIWDRPQRQSPKTYHYTLDPEAYMAKHSLVKKTSSDSQMGSGILAKTESYFLKSRKFCKETILASGYPNLVQTLDCFVTDIIETSSHLQGLEVDTSLPKQKQKSQAKNILQQKHRALADLFKSLSKIGLSFRTGIIESKLKDFTTDFLLRPVDLSANFSHISHGRKEEKILTIWDSCEIYYVRSMMRNDVLETALNNPAKDLGIQNLERCKGFTSHLMNLAQKQKTELIESTRAYYYLRFYLKQLNDSCEGKQFLHVSVLENARELLKNLTTVMEQSKIILNSCPSQDSLTEESLEVPLLKYELGEHIEYKNDSTWTKAMGLINDVLGTANKLNVHLHKSRSYAPSVDYQLVHPQFIPILDLKGIENELADIYNNLDNLKQLFGNVALTESFSWLMAQITVIEEQFETPYTTDSVDINKTKKRVEKFAESNLVVVQNLYKKYVTGLTSIEDRPKTTSGEPENEEDKELQEDHLKKLLIEDLSSDISMLDMKNILKSTHKLSQILLKTSPQSGETLKSLISPCLPLLEQTLHLYQYFITQQVSTYRVVCKMTSILLNIFIELATKGFCVPPEFSEEMDGEGISKPSDGLGLGEGEGEKDVSDKIESEDQLHDAQPAGQEKEKEEDKDCKEEEKGIEMSEDFDSKLQDKEKKGDDEDESESDDSDADEQMGETDKGADQLDKEIWGSDKEEEDEGEEDSGQKEEKGDKGEKDGEDHLGAKDENPSEKSAEEKDDKNSAEEKEKNKKDINEIEEPQYDDDQIDPHHGKQPELPEPEPMDLPDDINLDDGQENDNENDNQEENPFDIDAMKEQNPPEEKSEDKEVDGDKTENDEEKEFSSDDEDITRKDEDESGQDRDKDEDEEDKVKADGKEETEVQKSDKEEERNPDMEETGLDDTQTNQEHVEAMEIDDAEATDKTEATQPETQASSQPIDELCQEDRPDKEGVGQSQMEESKTGHSTQANISQEIKSSKRESEEDQIKKQKPGESNLKRSLGDVNEPVKKKLKTIDAKDETRNPETDDTEEENVDIYQHIKEAKEAATQVLDAATKEQAEQQKQDVPNKEDEEAEQPPEKPGDMLSDEEPEDMETVEAQAEKLKESDRSKDKKSNKKQHPEGDILEEIQDIEVEGDVIETMTVPRSTESTHHTQYSNVIETTAVRLSLEEINNLRSEVESQLSAWNEPPSTAEADEMWQKISSVTSSLAQDLSEQLRLVLEPTQASRLRGDFRSGRRINMRKVIPYIASQFRKDKIWLRRTKPSKREYQIILAIDDSSSMADNHSKELAFESVSLISKALTLLESGQLSVVSFGESVEVLHKLTDQFTDRSGVKLLQKFKFDQNKTCVAKLVDFCTEMFGQSHAQSSALNARLLVVVSDGRGVFSEGETYVRQAVRRAKLSNIFMVFVIVDNPENKSSVLDIRMPVFKDGKLLGIQTYMDVFPFSFYIILRDINSLPSVLSDALRQWFEVVSNLDN